MVDTQYICATCGGVTTIKDLHQPGEIKCINCHGQIFYKQRIREPQVFIAR